ncbi:MAG: cation:proton antiporter [Treponema sp.]|nr:cation:proton antiporter [Treponema sp.]
MNILYYLGIVLLAGLGVAKILRKIKFPNVTGYLIAGILIGHNVLNLVPKNIVTELNIVSEVALGFIAYSIGSSFRFSNLKQQGKGTVVIAFMEALMAMLLVFLVLFFVLKTDLPFALMISSIACATAPAATLMVIRQYNAKGPLVDTLLPVVALDDMVSIIAFGVAASISKALISGTGTNIQAMLLVPFWEITLAFLLGISLGLLLTLFLKFTKSEGNYLNIIIAVIFIGIAIAIYFKISPLLLCMALGAFIANALPNPAKAFNIVDPITTPIFVIFFTISGAALDLGSLVHVGVIGVTYLVVRAIGKWIGTYISCKMFNKPKTVTRYLGIALMPQAGVALGLSLMAANLIGGEHGDQVRTVILATTVVYELIGPLAAKFALKKAGELHE